MATVTATEIPVENPATGEVSDGMDVVDKIEALPTDHRDKPREDAVMESVTVNGA